MLAKWLQITDRIHQVSRVAAMIGALFGVSIMVLASGDVALRILRNHGIQGVDGMIESLLVGMVFLGLAEVERKKGHIAFAMVTDRMSTKFSSLVQAVGLALAAALIAWIAWLTIGQAWESWERKEFRFGDVALLWWPAKAVLALGFILLLMEMIITVVGHIVFAFSGKSIEVLEVTDEEELFV